MAESICVIAPSANAHLTSKLFKKACMDRMGFCCEPNHSWKIIDQKHLYSTPFVDIVQYATPAKKNTGQALLLSSSCWKSYSGSSRDTQKITPGFMQFLNERNITHEPFYLIGQKDVYLMTRGSAGLSYFKYSLRYSRMEDSDMTLSKISTAVFQENFGIVSVADCPKFFTTEKMVEFLKL